MATFYSDTDPVDVDDVFPGWILGADVSSLTAIGGAGKGLMTADVMARISRGWPMPPYLHDDPLVDHDQVALPGYVLHCTLEDAPDRTVRKRLDACAADTTRIAFLDELALPEDFGKLRFEIEDLPDCRAVVIDPWMSAAHSTTAFNQQLRIKLLNPLIHIARETGAGIWLVNHFTKGTNGGRLAPNSSKALTDYIAGSKGFTDTLRMNTVITDSELDPKIKQWRFLKGNGGGCEPLEYVIVADQPNDPDAHIEWRQPAVNVNDPRHMERLQAAILDELIAAGRPMSPQEMVRAVRLSFALVNRVMGAMEKTGTLAKKRGAFTPRAIEPPRETVALTAPAPPAGGGLDWWADAWKTRP